MDNGEFLCELRKCIKECFPIYFICLGLVGLKPEFNYIQSIQENHIHIDKCFSCIFTLSCLMECNGVIESKIKIIVQTYLNNISLLFTPADETINLIYKILNGEINIKMNLWGHLQTQSVYILLFVLNQLRPTKVQMNWLRLYTHHFTYSDAVAGWTNVYSYRLYQMIEQDRAARTIQAYCHNWLWKPYTADGKVGINPRLVAKKICTPLSF